MPEIQIRSFDGRDRLTLDLYYVVASSFTLFAILSSILDLIYTLNVIPLQSEVVLIGDIVLRDAAELHRPLRRGFDCRDCRRTEAAEYVKNGTGNEQPMRKGKEHCKKWRGGGFE